MAFGSTSSGGLFGNTNNNTSSSIFGNNNNKSGGLFGNTSNNTTSGGLFGNSNTNTSSGGLFGNNNNKSTSLFGNSGSTSSGGLFGNTTNNSSSGGLFGNTNNTSSGGLFGNSNTNKSGGLFGSSTNTSGGLFGNSNNTSSGGLFGNTNNTSTSGGLFGNSGSSGSSLFGSNNNNSGGLFGNTSSSGGLFGNNTNSSSGGLFGNNNNNSSGFVFNGSNTNQAQNPELAAMEILSSYDPSNPKFRFKTVMYMQVQPSQIAQYQKPAELTTEQWDRANRDKPELDCVPVVVKGFEQLKQRVDHFEAGKKSTEVMLAKLKKTIAKMKQDHEAHISSIVEAKKRQFTLSHRLLKLLRQLAKLRGKNTPLSPEEALIERRLKEIMMPNGKLLTLSTTRDHVDGTISNMPRPQQSKTRVPDDANMKKIFQFLSKQQEDIGKVLQLIEQDLKKAQKTIQT